MNKVYSWLYPKKPGLPKINDPMTTIFASDELKNLSKGIARYDIAKWSILLPSLIIYGSFALLFLWIPYAALYIIPVWLSVESFHAIFAIVSASHGPDILARASVVFFGLALQGLALPALLAMSSIGKQLVRININYIRLLWSVSKSRYLLMGP